MTTDVTVLEIKRIFPAPPSRIFNAWLNRHEFQAWIGPEGINCDVPLHEPTVGGRYRIIMKMSDGRVIPVAGTFTAIEPPRHLAFTWGWENDAGRQSLVTVTLTDMGGKTEMTLRQEGLATEEDRDAHSTGWNSALNKLTAYLT